MKRSYINSKSSNPLSILEHKADALIQMVVCRNTCCAVCHNPWGLAGHHIITKAQCRGSIYLMRYDPRNLVPLCRYCHVPFAHEQEDKWKLWMRGNMAERYGELRRILDSKRMDARLRTEENIREIIKQLNGCLG